MTHPEFSTPDPLRTAKWAFTTRRIDRTDATCLTYQFHNARPGDLVLARVERIRSHKRIQLTTGRPSELYDGDVVVLACGARYASDQYEGIAEIDPQGADMLASGGVIGKARSSNRKMAGPTQVVPIGLVSDAEGRVLNVGDYALPPAVPTRNMTVIAAVGTSMNGGKTTAVASLAHGLVRAGYRVATLKATGTGAFGDYNAYLDAGSHFVADLVDVGMVSTYLEPIPRIVNGMNSLLGHAAEAGCEVALVEFADGIFQRETSDLLTRPDVREAIDGVLLAAPCAASITGGYLALKEIGIEPSVVTGKISASPLLVAEAESAANVSIKTRETLRDPASAGALLAKIRGQAASGDVIRRTRSVIAA